MALATAKMPDGSNFTHERIGEFLGVSRVAVSKAIKKIPEINEQRKFDAEAFRQRRVDILSEVQHICLQALTPQKIRGSSAAQIAKILGIIYDKEKLEKGEATSHIATIHKHELDEDTKSAIRGIIKNMTEKDLIEARQASLEMTKTIEDDSDDEA